MTSTTVAERRRLRVLVLSTLYPTPQRPAFGVFVHQRVQHVARHCDVLVAAPVPWFPFNRWLRDVGRMAAEGPDCGAELRLSRPRFLSIPRIGKSLDPVLYFASLLPHLARLRRSFPFDVIDAEFGYPDGVAAVLLGGVFHCPTVMTFRGDEFRLTRHFLRRTQLEFAARHATRVIGVSDSLRQVAVRLGAAPERTCAIPNGVDGRSFRPLERAWARHQLGLPAERTMLLTVGARIERKGQHRVLEILPTLLRRRPDLLYVMVGGEQHGDGYTARLEELVDRYQLRSHVHIVPPQSHDVIPVWMAAADLYCLATRWEGWCNSLLEAMACGLPVVTTRVGGSEEFVREGADGFLVPYWEPEAFSTALLKALDASWDRRTIAAHARARGWHHTAEEVVRELHAAVQMINEERRHAASRSQDTATPDLRQ